jgi:hypothetical protein
LSSEEIQPAIKAEAKKYLFFNCTADRFEQSSSQIPIRSLQGSPQSNRFFRRMMATKQAKTMQTVNAYTAMALLPA